MEKYEFIYDKKLIDFIDILVNQIIHTANDYGIDGTNLENLSYEFYQNKDEVFNLEELKKEYNIIDLNIELIEFDDGEKRYPTYDEDIYFIFKININNKIYYIKGYGFDIDEWEIDNYEFVKPVEKTIITYQRV